MWHRGLTLSNRCLATHRMGPPVPDRRAWATEIALLVAQLNHSQSAVLRCRYFGGLDEADTSTATGLSIGQVRRAAASGLSELGRRIQCSQQHGATNQTLDGTDVQDSGPA